MKFRARVVGFLAITAVAVSCEKPQDSSLPSAPAFGRSSAPGQNVACTDDPRDQHGRDNKGPVVLACAFTLPSGSTPVVNGTKSWVDHGKLYLTETGNGAVYVWDVHSHQSLGKITGFVGNTGNAATSGPNSITFSKDGNAWVSDGISGVRVVDLHSMSIVATISTAIAACDNGTVHRCQRTNEITYVPEHHLIFVQNPSPLGVTSGTAIDTYGTFIDSRTMQVVGTISFPNRQGQEAPLWDKHQHRILTAVSGRQVVANGAVTAVYQQYVAVINPAVRPFTVEHEYDIDCTAHGLTTTTSAANPTGRLFGINDPSLAPNGKLVIPACGRAVFMDATTGAVTGFAPVAGGNETWYNSGDGNFYVTGAPFLGTSATAAGKNSLGVIEARESELEQYVPADTSVGVVGATNPAAAKDNNQIFAVVAGNATTATACTQFGFQASGCILVFAHGPGHGNGDADHDEHEDHEDDDD